jgi:ADP-ribose pyrophosphatase
VKEKLMKSKIKRLDRNLKYVGDVVDLYRDTMEYPDGSRHEWDFVHHKRANGALILPVLSDGRILMIRQYRPAVDDLMLQAPAGSLEPEDGGTQDAARRELEEETGYFSNNIKFMMRLYLASAYCDEWVDIYAAIDCRKSESGRRLDPGKDIETELYTVEELVDMVLNGKLIDSPTVAAVMAYAAGGDRFIGQ